MTTPPLSPASTVDRLRPQTLERIRNGLEKYRPAELATIEVVALGALSADLADCPSDCRRFFALLFAAPEIILKVHPVLSLRQGVETSTLMSRFYRAALPSPKQYVERALLIRMCGLMLVKERTLHAMAADVGSSSQQSLNRTIRRLTGKTGSQFFATSTADGLFAAFRDEMIVPHLGKLRAFHPYTGAAR